MGEKNSSSYSPRMDEAAAAIVGEKIRATLQHHPFGTEATHVHVTASIGMETAYEFEDLDTLIRNADRRCTSGRNSMDGTKWRIIANSTRKYLNKEGRSLNSGLPFV